MILHDYGFNMTSCFNTLELYGFSVMVNSILKLLDETRPFTLKLFWSEYFDTLMRNLTNIGDQGFTSGN